MEPKEINKKINGLSKIHRKEFCKKILQLHYELSEANSWNLVMRSVVAEKLGIKDFNDDKLLGAIKYLEDKGFLKAMTNMEDQITDLGIDEVENGFPSFADEMTDFPKEIPDRDELTFELGKILEEIDKAIDLGDKELLKINKLREVERNTKEKLKELKTYLDEEYQLKFEKLDRKTTWTSVYGEFANKKEVKDILEPWRDYLREVIEDLSGELPPRESHILTGATYDGRKILRMILRSATNEIIIIDNFLHPEILMVVEPYLDQIKTIKFLTRKKGNSNFSSFISDLSKFRQQYPNFQIEARENNKCHDRYIIIDGEAIYHSGPSFHDLGKKGGGINRMIKEEEINKFLEDFKDWWGKGQII